MFQFPAFAPSFGWYMVFNHVGSPIRTSPDQFLFADPRSFSQLTTSFFAFGSQGILRSLLFSFSRTYVNHNSTTNVSCVLLVLPYEIAVPTTRKNSNLLSDYNLFNFTSLSLSVLSMNLFRSPMCCRTILREFSFLPQAPLSMNF